MMTAEEKEKITDLKKCNFREICEYFKQESEKRKNRTKEEKKVRYKGYHKISKYWGRYKQCITRSDCSFRSSLTRVYTVCQSVSIFDALLHC